MPVSNDESKVVALPVTQRKPKTEDRKRLTDKWGAETMKAGFTVVPGVLLRCQARLHIGAMELAVLVHLLEHWWNPHDMPWPSKKKIAERLNVSQRTVQRATARLEEEGLLVKRDRYLPNSGGRTSNAYDLAPLVARLQNLAAEVNAEETEAQERRRAITRPGARTTRSKEPAKAMSNAQ